ncbi:hypothetical protein OSB04_010884 [Centaurea solstitialis]|uniref:Protein kinase domain-containing protein n=1 Tax=Centaurea solstitialis TaxID=347529 RepID=A0AA38TK52_9ASTR|nr:hypothetical protein OSB04_010884 [Centaurea solstitialis]
MERRHVFSLFWSRYNIIKEVGDGTFGVVWRALNKHTGEVVAIKKMKRKYYTWEECINLREVKSLRKMNHPNIVKLKEVIRENDILYFVFEYMECSLYQHMKDRVKPFSETEIRNWCFHVFQGLVYMHQHGYFHRDLKPAYNGLCWVYNEHALLELACFQGGIKLADFGLAREITSQPPYTEYVSTRWYRAPEVLLQSPTYGSLLIYGQWVQSWLNYLPSVHFFQVLGMYEADEIYKICSVIGSPTESAWHGGLEMASAINYRFPELTGVHLSTLIPSASQEAINLISALCSWDPSKRPTAVEALQHPFFQSCYYIPPSLRSKPATSRMPLSGVFTGSKWRRSVEQKYATGYSGLLPNVKPGQMSLQLQKYMHPSAQVSHIILNTADVLRKLEMNYQGEVKNEKTYRSVPDNQNTNLLERPIQHCVWCTAGSFGKSGGVSDTSEKLAHMAIGSARIPPPRQQPQQQTRIYIPPPAKAGMRNGRSDFFTGKSRDIQPGRAYCGKVAG